MLRESIMLGLCNVTRFSQLKFIVPDTDSEHTIRMQIYALEIYNRFPGIPIKDIIYRILLHDMDEAVLCDIPRNVKYYSDDSLKLINDIANDVLIKSGINPDIINGIRTAKHTGDKWDALIKYLDVYDAHSRLITEYKLQNDEKLIPRFTESFHYLKDIIGDSFHEFESDLFNYLSNDFKEVEDEFNSIVSKQEI